MMAMMKCILKPVMDEDSSSLPEIVLENGKPLKIGRLPETQILNKRCSKHQLEVIANFSTKTVKIKQLGPNHSGLNGNIIGMGMEEKACAGDVLEVLLKELKYKIVFEGDEGENGPPVAKMAKTLQQPTLADMFKKDGQLEKGKWEAKGEKNDVVVYVFGENMKDPKPYVAAFDMDGTLIGTNSGNTFPKNKDDWKLQYPNTKEKLRDFFQKNPDFKFVIFTNQAACKDDKQLNNMKRKIENIFRLISIPVLVFIAPNKNKYRKPLTASWDLFVEDYNGGVVPDLKESFYCGDAAGRIRKKDKNDHSLCDKLFALNVGITFKLPEQYFLGSVNVPDMVEPFFDPKKYLANASHNNHVKFPTGQEMIIMVGYPGSGKSSFVKNVILPRNYVHVNRDTLKTQDKCYKVTEEALKNNDSVVIDNTNPEKKDRGEYIKIAKKYKVPVRCFRMNVEHGHALHNAKFRELFTGVTVPAVAFNTFKGRYQEPVSEEGYQEIVNINFVPNFDSAPEGERQYRLKLYGSYLLEK